MTTFSISAEPKTVNDMIISDIVFIQPYDIGVARLVSKQEYADTSEIRLQLRIYWGRPNSPYNWYILNSGKLPTVIIRTKSS